MMFNINILYVAGKIIKKCLAKRQALNNFASKTYNIDIETSLKKIIKSVPVLKLLYIALKFKVKEI